MRAAPEAFNMRFQGARRAPLSITFFGLYDLQLLFFLGLYLPVATARDVYIAHWRPAIPSDVVDAIFGEYLTETVGQHMQPPVNFIPVPVMYDGTMPLQKFVFSETARLIDFYYLPAQAGLCWSLSPLAGAPLLNAIEGHGSAMIGGVVIARADNANVNTLQDIKGRVVSSLTIGAIQGWLLQDDLASQAGVNTMQDAKQVRMYLSNNITDVITDVLTGDAEVGYIPTGIFIAPLFFEQGGPFKVIEPKANANLPFPTSTALSPSTTFFATPRADQELTDKVVDALLSMNSSYPSAKRADLTGWRYAVNAEGLRSIMMRQGIMFMSEATGRLQCVGSEQLGPAAHSVIRCPANTFKRRQDAIADECLRVNATCPPRAVCFCKPCMDAQAVQLTPFNSLVTIDKCERTTLCGQTEQGRALQFEITDNLNRANVTFTFTVSMIEARNDDRDVLTGGTAAQTGANRYQFDAVISTAGLLLLQVFVAEPGKEPEHAPLSPVFVNVVPRSCPSPRTASLDGNCECGGRYFTVSGRCILVPWLVFAPMALLLLCAAIAVRIYLRRRLRAADVLWRIKATDLEFPDPPQVLGQGMHGEVLKARYRGTDVAVKSLLPFRSAAHHGAASESQLFEGFHVRRTTSVHAEIVSSSPTRQPDPTFRRLSMLASLQTSNTPESAVSASPTRSPLVKRRRKSACNDLGLGLPELLSGAFQGVRGAPKLQSSMDEVEEVDEGSPSPEDQDHGHPIARAASEHQQAAAADRLLGAASSASSGEISLSVSPLPAGEPPLQQQQQQQQQQQPHRPDTMPAGPPSTSAVTVAVNGRVRVIGATGVGGAGGSGRGGRARGGSIQSPPDGGAEERREGRAGSGSTLRSGSAASHGSVGSSATATGGARLRASPPSMRAASLGEQTLLPEDAGWVLGSPNARGASGWWRCKWWGQAERKERGRRAFVQEMRLLSRLRHPRITTVMGAVLSRDRPMLVMEMMRYGSLQDLYLNEVMELDGDVLLGMLKDVADGVFFLHSFQPCIVHGDIKAANILVDSMFRAKVSDLGMAGSKKFAGTPYWMAPELLTGRAPASTASDVFALGVTLCETLQRRAPYEGEDPITVLKHVVDPAVQKRPGMSAAINSAMHQLIQSCWDANPAHRPTMEQVRDSVASIPAAALDGMWGGEAHSEARWQSQSDTVVYEMYPKHVAEALLRGEEPKQDQSDSCSVFFSDVVGFTSLSAAMESHQVSDMLDRLFSRFDQLATHHGIYKLDTIGDCYIGVANLVEEQSTDHVARVAAFSLDVMKAAAETAIDPKVPSKGNISMRVGFDVGPVVGHLVGRKHKKYTIFGNTVNTASRMESTSIPDKIQCTQRAARLLLQQDPAFKLKHRGLVQVKGRGSLETYFVEARAEASQPLPPPPPFPSGPTSSGSSKALVVQASLSK